MATATEPVTEPRIPWYFDIAGLVWVLSAAVAVMLPALFHGVYLGPFDWLAHYGLPHQSGVTLHSPFAADQINQMIPWTSLAWTQVHHGQLPLWNPYSALGTPLAFNWQSSVFSLPALVGYLVPLHLDYTVQVFVTLAVAGSGAYVLGRTLRLTVVACVFAGTAFELSGSFMGWLGWPVAAVMSWTGWILAGSILIVRGDRRVRSIALLSVTLALAVYAGQPDTLILLGLFLVIFVVVLLALEARRSTRGLGALTRPATDLALASAAGLALSAPLWLPGLQLLSKSIRSVGGGYLGSQLAVPPSYFQPLILPGLNQWPLYWYHDYMGVISVVLAAVAVVLVVFGLVRRRSRAEVTALTAVAIAAGIVTFVQPVISAMNSLPTLEAVRFPRAITFLEFSVAMLAGVGLDLLVRSYSRRTVLIVAGIGFSSVGVVLLVSWVALPSGDTARTQGFIWAAAGTALGLGLVSTLALARRRLSGSGADVHDSDLGDGALDRRTSSIETEESCPADVGAPPRVSAGSSRAFHVAGISTGIVLLAFESVFLVTVGGPIWSSRSTPLPVSGAERQLQQTVGSSLVGLGNPMCIPSTLGIPANTNILYGVHELTAYDPMLPRAYYQAWSTSTGQIAGAPEISHYCPGITSSTEARTYGVSFVLEPHGSAGPSGAIFDKEIGGEDLYRVPHAAMATLTPQTRSGHLPPDGLSGTPVLVGHPSPNSLRMVTDSATPQVLRLRLTDVAGWRATDNGQPLRLDGYAGVMLQARLASGRHVIALSYWPRTFSAGIVLALLAAAVLLVCMIVAKVRRPR